VPTGGDTSVTIGLEPRDPAAKITVLYRINHGAPLTVLAAPLPNPPAGKQYYRAHLTGFKTGDKVEYVAVYRSGARQIPSNAEAENHVASFTLGPAAAAPHAAAHAPAGAAVEAEDLKAALLASLKATAALSSKALEDSFVKLYFAHTGDPESFWAEIARHADLKPHIEKLQFALQLDYLTAGHPPLIEALAKRPGVRSMIDLARLDDTQWHELIARSGTPAHIAGASRKARAERYADGIIATLQAAFPTLAVVQIARASHHVDELAIKFIDNAPDLDIRATRLDALADAHAETVFKGIPEARRAAILAEVKRLQRLFAVSPNAQAFRALLGTKLDSAHAIAAIPRASFVSHYGHLLGAQAAEIHDRAQFINARNLHLRLSIQEALTTPPTRALGHHSHAQMARSYAGHQPGRRSAAKDGAKEGAKEGRAGPSNLKPGSLQEDLVKTFPNATELFGSL
jgi:hypothetical protein